MKNKYEAILMEANNCWSKNNIPDMTPVTKGNRRKNITKKEKWN